MKRARVESCYQTLTNAALYQVFSHGAKFVVYSGLERLQSGLIAGLAGPDSDPGEASEALAASGPQLCCMNSAASSTGVKAREEANKAYPMMLKLFDKFPGSLYRHKEMKLLEIHIEMVRKEEVMSLVLGRHF